MDSLYLVILVAVVVILNGYSYLLFRSDKIKARNDQWRIPENKLLVASFFGPFGAFSGIKRYHHKTRKLKFKLVGLFLAIQVIAVVIVLIYIIWPDLFKDILSMV
jgi:uncharacterized membrane protein YsdA (DUF1294 family)